VFLHRIIVATQRYFHLHLVSDATGETLINVGRAAAAQYNHTHSIEHIHSLVRTQAQVERALREIEQSPGIVLYTLVNGAFASTLENGCRTLGIPVSRFSTQSWQSSNPISARARLGVWARSTFSTRTIFAASMP
jgi:regulator of PEP synthase PpsR (kinase-PPPase family)